MQKKKLNMTSIIMISMVLGLIFGVAVGKSIPAIEMIGQIFLRLVQMSIVLLVTGQIIEAIGGIEPSAFGKIGLKTIIIFSVSTILAAIMGIAMALIFQPGTGVSMVADAGAKVTQAPPTTIFDTLISFFPSNIIQAMSNGSIMQSIVFAIFFGFALNALNRDGNSALYNLVKQFNRVIMRIIQIVMYMAPLGVFALLASSIGKYGLKVILPLAKYLGTYGFSTLIFMILWIALVSAVIKVSILEIIKRVSRMSLVALATTSSAVTLPVEMEDAEKKLGIGKKISQIVLPLGVTLNSNGAAMHMAITIMTIAQLYGYSYSLPTLLYIAILASFASLANAVVPGAGLVSLSMVVPQMGLPLESIALFAGVEWFVGMLRTILNVDSDTFSALLVAKSENDLDYSVYKKAIKAE